MTSADFFIGQRVRCADPDGFLSEWRNYLRGREGAVLEIGPAPRTDIYLAHVGEVHVRWHMRSGRGKERTKWMRPSDLLPVTIEAGAPT